MMYIWGIQSGIQGGASSLFKSNAEAFFMATYLVLGDLTASKKRRITKNVLKVGPPGNYVT